MVEVTLPVERILWASQQPEILGKIESLYAELTAEIERHSPTCWNKGECCHFGKFGHRLYVTPLELAWFVARLNVGWVDPADGEAVCPYKAIEACSVRTARPVGCRIFYCQEGTELWQQEITERYLGRLRSLHLDYDVDYAYCEWLGALRQITQSSFDVIGLYGYFQKAVRDIAQSMSSADSTDCQNPRENSTFSRSLNILPTSNSR